MSSLVVGRVIAAAGGGLVVGAAGMFVYDRRTGRPAADDKKSGVSGVVSKQEPPSIPADSSVASEFIMPFVNRYGLPDLDQVILPSYEYTSCWDSRNRNARWVVERINIATITGTGDRKRATFRPDSRLQPLFRSELSDFKGSGFDRGHLAPAGDHKTTEEYLKETFLLSNMAPQEPSFNRGYWADFEEWVRLLVIPKERNRDKTAISTSGVGPPFKDVYVITGPLYLPSLETTPTVSGARVGGAVDAEAEGVVEISPSPSSSPASSGIAGGKYVLKLEIIGNPMRMVAVPTHFFKVIIAEPFPSQDDGTSISNETYVAAFAMPNVDIPAGTDLRKFLVPLEALESVAGMRFMAAASSAGGGFDEAARVHLDTQALALRAVAGVPALPFDSVNRSDSGYHKLEAGQTEASEAERRLFRHVCSVASCVGV